MSEDLIISVQELIKSGIGDSKRLRGILYTLKEEGPLYLSDYKYLQSLISNLTQIKEDQNKTSPSKNSESSDEDYNVLILKNRVAKGEITVDEFRALKNVLRQE